jgi:hypothetical protein
MAERTALQIVNEVQKRLRLPQTPQADFATNGHSVLLLSFLNMVMRDIMGDYVWDELKVYDHFHTVDGTATYTVTLSGSPTPELDQLLNLQISTSDPLVKYEDEDFRSYARANTSEGQPLIYRIRSRTETTVTIELCPTPDAAYQVDIEALRKQPKLVEHGDTPLLDTDLVVEGLFWYAKQEQGEEVAEELEIFKLKLASLSSNAGSSGDVEAI